MSEFKAIVNTEQRFNCVVTLLYQNIAKLLKVPRGSIYINLKVLRETDFFYLLRYIEAFFMSFKMFKRRFLIKV